MLKDLTLNPLLKIAATTIRFRDKNGRYCVPSKGFYFEVLPPGKRKPLKGEIPKEYRKTVALRKAYVASILVAYSREKSAKEKKLRPKQLKKKKAQARKKKDTPAIARAKKEATKRELKELAKEEYPELEEEEIEKEILPKYKPPQGIPKVSKIKAVETLEKGKFVTGKIYQPKRPDSREGTKEYIGKTIELDKYHIDLVTPIPVHPIRPEATATALKEFFRIYANQFMLKMRGQSDNAYIMRVKTINRITGERAKNQGIGTERFKLSKTVTPAMRQIYRGMSDQEILLKLHMEQMQRKIDDLFDYFVERYGTYFAQRNIEDMLVRGFSIEVVKGIT